MARNGRPFLFAFISRWLTHVTIRTFARSSPTRTHDQKLITLIDRLIKTKTERNEYKRHSPICAALDNRCLAVLNAMICTLN